MSFPRFKNRKIEGGAATTATLATFAGTEAERIGNVAEVASVASVAGVLPQNAFFAQPAPAAASIDLAAFHERGAIREYDGVMPREEADQAAAREMGFDTAADLYRAAIEAWRSEVIAAPETKLHGFDKLKSVSLHFLDSDWALIALAAGWDELALFAVHQGRATRERLDAQGLFPVLAWGTHRYSIAGFDANACLLRTSNGAELRQQRHRANFDAALAWWLHPTLSHGERSCEA
jgi:hypothetical protein